MYNRKTNWDS